MESKIKATKFTPGLVTKSTNYATGAVSFVAAATVVTTGISVLGPAIAVSLGAGTISFCANRVAQARLKKHQVIRDERADEIFNSLSKSKMPTFYSLYLRAFSTTGKMPKQVVHNNFEQKWGEIHSDFESIIALSVENFCPLIALGHKGENIGAGRVECNEIDWKKKLKKLAQKAKYIFIIPFNTKGTLWEIDFIKKYKIIDKCIFLMPNVGKMFIWGEKHEVNWGDKWNNILNATKNIDIQLPKYDPKGMIFLVNGSGKVTFSDEIGSELKIKKFQKKIKIVCDRINSSKSQMA